MMTQERFERLAEAYGGDIRRWPDVEREAALAYAATSPAAGATLAREGPLDIVLDGVRVAEPSEALRRAVIAAAPAARQAGRIGRWLATAGLGFGLAMAGACGVAVGLTLAPAGVTHMIGGPPAQPADDLTALIDPSQDGEGV